MYELSLSKDEKLRVMNKWVNKDYGWLDGEEVDFDD